MMLTSSLHRFQCGVCWVQRIERKNISYGESQNSKALIMEDCTLGSKQQGLQSDSGWVKEVTLVLVLVTNYQYTYSSTTQYLSFGRQE